MTEGVREALPFGPQAFRAPGYRPSLSGCSIFAIEHHENIRFA